jgi:hypothetical protein
MHMPHGLKFGLKWNLSRNYRNLHVVNGDIYERVAGLGGGLSFSQRSNVCTGSKSCPDGHEVRLQLYPREQTSVELLTTLSCAT